ncbi:MAG: hypothetical protein MPN21_23825 [Thermoanaerobaculia bacterium]|nr:hypothetical protein [Thermoanaerobaculia bacterium]
MKRTHDLKTKEGSQARTWSENRERRLQELLGLGLDTPPDERARALREAEADDELVEEALALLEEESETFLEPALRRLASAAGADTDLPHLS